MFLEGDHYFPPDSVNYGYVRASDYHTTCFWKGRASYYGVVVDGEVNVDAPWYCPQPKEAAKLIADLVAFWKGVVLKE
jgi:uncharacterized protein (DUF427 family)